MAKYYAISKETFPMRMSYGYMPHNDYEQAVESAKERVNHVNYPPDTELVVDDQNTIHAHILFHNPEVVPTGKLSKDELLISLAHEVEQLKRQLMDIEEKSIHVPMDDAAIRAIYDLDDDTDVSNVSAESRHYIQHDFEKSLYDMQWADTSGMIRLSYPFEHDGKYSMSEMEGEPDEEDEPVSDVYEDEMSFNIDWLGDDYYDGWEEI
jgi:hypothetical protein